MRLQVNNEFQQVWIKNLKNQNNVEMFTSSIWGGKAFAGEQKIKELKTRMAKLNAQKLKISPTKIILSLNLMKSTKYGLAPEEIEWRSLAGECFKTIFNMHKSEKIEKLHCRQDAYDVKKYSAKRKKLDASVKKFLFLLRELERSCSRQIL